VIHRKTLLLLLPLLLLAGSARAQTPIAGRIVVANAGSTGTTLNKLTKLTGAPSTAVRAATTDTSGVVGITEAGAGTSGSAVIQTSQTAACIFDGATTAGDYVQISGSTAGDCHDAGATYPSSGQVLGRVLSTNGSGGTYSMYLFPPEIEASAAITSNNKIRDFGTTFGDTGGSALTSGSVVYFTVPFACTISAWNMAVDAGTATIDIWKIATGTAIPTVTNTITASALPAIASGTALHSTTLTSWTTSVSANDIFGFQLKTVATAKFVSIDLECDQ
jgi:hypothetical protein